MMSSDEESQSRENVSAHVMKNLHRKVYYMMPDMSYNKSTKSCNE